MTCKDYAKNKKKTMTLTTETNYVKKTEPDKTLFSEQLRFGVNSWTPAENILQNNLTLFEWVTRNKLFPDFWGRYLSGENCLTKSEIEFLHDRGCKIAVLYHTSETKQTEQQGEAVAEEILKAAFENSIPENTAVFLEVDEKELISRDFMRGLGKILLSEGFIAGFKTNTDAKFNFDREYSRGMQSDIDIFSKCVIWATAPCLAEYERTTTTHFIHPDEWLPYAPSGITRGDIAVWQYGKNCHPIQNDKGKEVTFDVNLVRNDRLIIERMF